MPEDAPQPLVGGLQAEQIDPLVFGKGPLAFAVPGMSDVMPYPSSRFAAMTKEQLGAYRSAWRQHLRNVLDEFRPQLIHAHHIWILSSLLKDLAPEIPVVHHCHATGFRQMSLCPHLADEVKLGCRRNDRFAVLHQGHAQSLKQVLGVDDNKIHVVGAGYRQELFHASSREKVSEPKVLYVGKYSFAKGLPWLLDAIEHLARGIDGLQLHVAGSGSGQEATALEARMTAMSPVVQLHGQLPQAQLAELMRQCKVLVLPSLYEGVPLVLVEAMACGCRLISTELPGVVEQIAPHLGSNLTMIAMPRIETVDQPVSEDLPAFVERLTSAIEYSLHLPDLLVDRSFKPHSLRPFTWAAVFERIEPIWRELTG